MYNTFTRTRVVRGDPNADVLGLRRPASFRDFPQHVATCTRTTVSTVREYSSTFVCRRALDSTGDIRLEPVQVASKLVSRVSKGLQCPQGYLPPPARKHWRKRRSANHPPTSGPRSNIGDGGGEQNDGECFASATGTARYRLGYTSVALFHFSLSRVDCSLEDVAVLVQ